MLRLRDRPDQYTWLDAAQVIKHAFGLARSFPDRPVTLLYLFWEPANPTAGPEFVAHRDEIEGVQGARGRIIAGVRGDELSGTLALLAGYRTGRLAGPASQRSSRPIQRHALTRQVRRAERSTCGRVQIGSGLLSISSRTHSSRSRSGMVRA